MIVIIITNSLCSVYMVLIIPTFGISSSRVTTTLPADTNQTDTAEGLEAETQVMGKAGAIAGRLLVVTFCHQAVETINYSADSVFTTKLLGDRDDTLTTCKNLMYNQCAYRS